MFLGVVWPIQAAFTRIWLWSNFVICRSPLEPSFDEKEWLIFNLTAGGSPAPEQKVNNSVWFWVFWQNIPLFNLAVGEPLTLWSGNPPLSSSNLTQDHFIKIEWLIAKLSVPGPLPEQKVFFGSFWTSFGQFRQATHRKSLWGPLCTLTYKTSLWHRGFTRLMTDVTAVGQKVIFWMIFGVFGCYV